MENPFKRFRPVLDGDQRYVDSSHASQLKLPPGTTITAIGSGIANMLLKAITVEGRKGQEPPFAREIDKRTFLSMNHERRRPFNPLGSPLQKPVDNIIDEILDRLNEDRARKIKHAIFAALNPHENAHLPKNSFRETDDIDSVFPLVVAVEQALKACVSGYPARFMSVTRDRDSYKDPKTGKFEPKIFSSTADETYCATIQAAIKALLTGRKIEAQPLTILLGQLTPPPPGLEPETAATGASAPPSPDQLAPGPPPETSGVTAPPASEQPAQNPPPETFKPTDAIIPTGTQAVSPGPQPPQGPPLDSEEWWNDEKWPDA